MARQLNHYLVIWPLIFVLVLLLGFQGRVTATSLLLNSGIANPSIQDVLPKFQNAVKQEFLNKLPQLMAVPGLDITKISDKARDLVAMQGIRTHIIRSELAKLLGLIEKLPRSLRIRSTDVAEKIDNLLSVSVSHIDSVKLLNSIINLPKSLSVSSLDLEKLLAPYYKLLKNPSVSIRDLENLLDALKKLPIDFNHKPG